MGLHLTWEDYFSLWDFDFFEWFIHHSRLAEGVLTCCFEVFSRLLDESLMIKEMVSINLYDDIFASGTEPPWLFQKTSAICSCNYYQMIILSRYRDAWHVESISGDNFLCLYPDPSGCAPSPARGWREICHSNQLKIKTRYEQWAALCLVYWYARSGILLVSRHLQMRGLDLHFA